MAPNLIEPSAEPGTPTEASLISTEIAIIAAVTNACAISIVSYWKLKKRK